MFDADIRSAHDCSEGGLLVALAECCISHQSARETFHFLGATLELPVVEKARLDALLFGETQGRIVVSTRDIDAVKVMERARILGISATRLGQVGGETLEIKHADRQWSWPVHDLHDLWWNSISRVM